MAGLYNLPIMSLIKARLQCTDYSALRKAIFEAGMVWSCQDMPEA